MTEQHQRDGDAGLTQDGEAGVSARRVFDHARAEAAVRELLEKAGWVG